jgi:hypothetical protein
MDGPTMLNFNSGSYLATRNLDVLTEKMKGLEVKNGELKGTGHFTE